MAGPSPAPVVHLPVLRDAVVHALQPDPGGRYLDGTVGRGGHLLAVLEACAPGGLVVGIDRDADALVETAERIGGDPRAQLVRGSFADMVALAGAWAPFRGILLDLGVSSPQLDRAERGFSFQADGPLDMRMDRSQLLTAADLLDGIDEPALVRLLRDYGEEPRARPIARAILAGRPWSGTLALADAVVRASGYRNSRTHPATRTFQALRIAVNDELGQLEQGLDAALSLLEPGGRLVIISFHSLEDRLVKRRLRAAAGAGAPQDAYGHPVVPPYGRLVGRISGRTSDPDNPRARSAWMRVFERAPGRVGPQP